MKNLFLQQRNSNTKDVVILFHGWAGGKENVKELAFEIFEKKKVNVYIPVLTGHECNDKKEFTAASHKDWLDDIDRAVANMVSEGYRVVAFGGYSMGGLLATIAAEAYSIPELILIAPSFYVRNKWIGFTPLVSLFVKSFPRRKAKSFPKHAQYFDDKYERTQKEVYLKNIWIKPGAELYRLQKIARKAYKRNLDVDITIFFSKADETVGERSRSFALPHVRKHRSITPLVIPEGNHQICNDTRFNKSVIKFITDHMLRRKLSTKHSLEYNSY